MIDINIQDVLSVLDNIKFHLIALILVLAAAIVVIVAVKGQRPDKKALIRGNAGIAMVLAFAVVVNLICFGPVYNMLNMALVPLSLPSEESTTEARALSKRIGEEGFVLLENDGILPLTDSQKLNVFGWASISACYGGTLSASLLLYQSAPRSGGRWISVEHRVK